MACGERQPWIRLLSLVLAMVCALLPQALWGHDTLQADVRSAGEWEVDRGIDARDVVVWRDLADNQAQSAKAAKTPKPSKSPSTPKPTKPKPTKAPVRTKTPTRRPTAKGATRKPSTAQPTTESPTLQPTTSTPSAHPTPRPTFEPQRGLLSHRSHPAFRYLADPNAVVVGNTIYLFCSTDPFDANSASTYTLMREYSLLTTSSVEKGVEWIHHGVVLRPTRRFPQIKQYNAKMMFAPGVIFHGGWFYLYFPFLRNPAGSSSIGIARAQDPTKEANWELVQSVVPGLNLFDPAIMRAPDGRLYIYGNSRGPGEKPTSKKMLGAVLEPHSLAAPLTKMKRIYKGVITEAVYTFWRTFYDHAYGREATKYYFIARVQRPNRDGLQYWIADEPLPVIPRNDPGFRLTNNQYDAPAHGSVVEFKGRYYLFYHTGAENNGNRWKRSSCMDEIVFRPDGTIVSPVQLTCAIATKRTKAKGRRLLER